MRGRPMSTLVETAASPHRLLVEALNRLPRQAILDAERLLGRPRGLESTVRLIAGIAAICTATEGRRVSAGGALSWFLGSQSPAVGEPVDRLAAARWTTDPDDRLVALLPYVLDPFGLTTRRALLSGQACGRERASRKRTGTFYTPGDVARVLVDEAITPATRRVLDPACGAGVFLRAAFTRLAAAAPPDRAIECLYGVDIDAAAIDACGLVLVHDWLMRQPLSGGEAPIDRFELICARLGRADALDLFAQPPPSRLFHGDTPTTLPQFPPYFDAVLTNPPFAALGTCTDRVRNGYRSLRAARNPTGVNMMWPFWELASRAVTRGGRVAIVLPLAAAYANAGSPRAARKAVFDRGKWEMRFFDRSPDALFGDDVKQRIALALRSPGTSTLIRTTAMRRWSADRRAAALAPDDCEGVHLKVSDGPLLKIGSTAERDALAHLQSWEGTLGEAASRARLVTADKLDRGQRVVAVAPTAYNWIGGFRDTAAARDARRHAAGKLAELTFPSRVLADAAYGVIASHIFLWWWRATGDLFHVPLTALTHAPFAIHKCAAGRLQALAGAGRQCWLSARETPILAVNKGIATVAFSAAAESDALELADHAVGAALGLTSEFVQFTRNDAVRLRSAGRTI
jgi:hypothetical protein